MRRPVGCTAERLLVARRRRVITFHQPVMAGDAGKYSIASQGLIRQKTTSASDLPRPTSQLLMLLLLSRRS